MSDIYEELNIDKSKLKRDYVANPLKKIKSEITNHYEYEKPLRNDLEYLYCEVLLSIKNLAKYFNCSRRVIVKFLNFYNLTVTLNDINYKRQRTCLKKYGVPFPLRNQEIKSKVENTCLKKYGVKHYAQKQGWNEEYQAYCLKNYGVINVFQLESVKEKSQQTCLKNYGVPNYSQSLQMKNYMRQQNVDDERKQKEYKTKEKNQTFNVSKDETIIFELLKSKYQDVIHQYRSKKYPFNCDFYIPEIDTYIEYQGSWHHRKEPYIGTDEQKEIVEKWHLKSLELNFQGKEKKQYKRAIKIWTIEDPLKRKTAKDNNLNWLEFFDMNQFMEWYNNKKEE